MGSTVKRSRSQPQQEQQSVNVAGSVYLKRLYVWFEVNWIWSMPDLGHKAEKYSKKKPCFFFFLVLV